MARIAGVDIPNDKRVVISLTYIFGIGQSKASKILAAAKVDENKRVKDLTEEELTAIRSEVLHHKTEGDLRREVSLNVKRLQEIGVIVVKGIEGVYQHVVNAPRLMLGPVKVERPLPTRKQPQKVSRRIRYLWHRRKLRHGNAVLKRLLSRVLPIFIHPSIIPLLPFPMRGVTPFVGLVLAG